EFGTRRLLVGRLRRIGGGPRLSDRRRYAGASHGAAHRRSWCVFAVGGPTADSASWTRAGRDRTATRPLLRVVVGRVRTRACVCAAEPEFAGAGCVERIPRRTLRCQSLERGRTPAERRNEGVSMSGTLQIRSASRTDKGNVRQVNEDSCVDLQ